MKRYLIISSRNDNWSDDTDYMKLYILARERYLNLLAKKKIERGELPVSLKDAVESIGGFVRALDCIYTSGEEPISMTIVHTEKVGDENEYVVEITGFDNLIFDNRFT